jgi:hypothetical protein
VSIVSLTHALGEIEKEDAHFVGNDLVFTRDGWHVTLVHVPTGRAFTVHAGPYRDDWIAIRARIREQILQLVRDDE